MAIIKDRIRELKRVRARDLVPNPKNFRLHPTSQKNALSAVLKEIGYADALLVREDNLGKLHLIDGHLRAETTPDDEVPILILDVTEDEADRLLLTHDPIGAMATSDARKLDDLMRAVSFEDPAVKKMLAALGREAGVADLAPDIIQDTLPDLKGDADVITQRGDLWLLGNHRLLCGDSTNADHVAKLLDRRKPLMMVTDPPYGVEYDASWRLDAGLDKIGQNLAYDKVHNDDRSDWRQAWMLFPGDVVYVWHASSHSPTVHASLTESKFIVRSQIIWNKNSLIIGRGHYHFKHEPCWYAVRKGATGKWTGDRKQCTVWDIPCMHANTGKIDDMRTSHSTQKPVECMARPMRNHGDAKDAVYDPFLGSGTTIIAGEQLGRSVYGLELEPAYCDMIVQRWENFTGKKAERIPAQGPAAESAGPEIAATQPA